MSHQFHHSDTTGRSLSIYTPITTRQRRDVDVDISSNVHSSRGGLWRRRRRSRQQHCGSIVYISWKAYYIHHWRAILSPPARRQRISPRQSSGGFRHAAWSWCVATSCQDNAAGFFGYRFSVIFKRDVNTSFSSSDFSLQLENGNARQQALKLGCSCYRAARRVARCYVMWKRGRNRPWRKVLAAPRDLSKYLSEAHQRYEVLLIK